jgi:glycerol-3-phosphate acyltransferase PlsY
VYDPRNGRESRPAGLAVSAQAMGKDAVLADVTAVIVGYLLGSIPFSQLIARWRAGVDIRSVGIGNAGARNVWHVVGPAWGLLAFALDAFKGAAAVLLARAIGASARGGIFAGPAAILGHAYPIYCRFAGGIGLSTMVGVLLVWTPLPALASLAIWVAAQSILRNLDRSLYVGAAAAIVLPGAFGYPWTMGAYALGLFCLLWALKLLARARQRGVWRASGWEGITRSDWYGESERGGRETPGSLDATDEGP